MVESRSILLLIVIVSSRIGVQIKKEEREKGESKQMIVDREGNRISLEPPEAMVYDLWHHFQARHMRTYANQTEQDYRLEVFKNNYKHIYKHNVQYFNQPGYSTYYLDINEYADLTQDEFKQRNGFKVVEEGWQQKVVKLDQHNIPLSWNWRDQYMVTPVKNQAQCASCWAFATVAAIESSWMINKSTNNIHNINNNSDVNVDEYELSEQQLVDCSKDGNNGCNGGSITKGLQYCIENGVTSNEVYPYNGKEQECEYNIQQRVFSPKDYRNVEQNNNGQLKAAITINPVAVAIDASSISFQFYRGGVFQKDCGTQIDHAVLIVGYIQSQNNQPPHYVIKNSWGTGWGQNGYFMLLDNQQDDQGTCGVQMYPSYPVA